MSEMQQKDLVLTPNTFAYVLDRTKGQVSVWVGPVKTSLSTSDELVIFDEKTKQFVTSSYQEAIQLFVTAPEGWYVSLKNPSSVTPDDGKANPIPDDIDIGKKINIPGPCSFALYPGQIAKVIEGHILKSNEYLVARVYNANVLNKSKKEGNEEQKGHVYVNGEILIIKGTEISYYIPPTGIEVVKDEMTNSYVRKAVTLERLEYCILKDENGKKRYEYGPAVVFPKSTESFVPTKNNSFTFKAIELSDISGIYLKVIEDYMDENEKLHEMGEELFITGKTQKIYYPRAEHILISYDGKFVHHAIAIPEGEGRYVMNRLSGEIKTVVGPNMYLPDPRYEVVVQRKLTRKECELFYPGNKEVIAYNESLSEKTVEKSTKKLVNPLEQITTSFASLDGTLYSAISYSGDDVVYKNAFADPNSLNELESSAKISRGTSYTKPRTITLDNKYNGVVGINIWSGYAVNVLSKNGGNRIVKGPANILLDYDETLESLALSTGKPKTTDSLEKTAFLKYKNNQVSDVINIETKDYVSVSIKLSYNVSFDENQQDKWFMVNNYVKWLCDKCRSIVKEKAKEYTIKDFYERGSLIVKEALMDKDGINYIAFEENGMKIDNVDVLKVGIEDCFINDLFDEHQVEKIKEQLRIERAVSEEEKNKILSELNKEKEKREAEYKATIEELRHAYHLKQIENEKLEKEKIYEKELISANSKLELSEKESEILEKQNEMDRSSFEVEKERATALANIEINKQQKMAESIKTVIQAIGPDLAVALSNHANQDTLKAIAAAISPYALAKGDNVADAVATMVNDLSLNSIIDRMKGKNTEQ